MQKFLRIANQGLVEPLDMALMGSSTKRDDASKIGQFGSGFKYALAWLLRNSLFPIIMAGERLVEITTKEVIHRGLSRQVIHIDGENTNITTEMGPDWTGWMALRELISNAIDEGEEKVHIVTSTDSYIQENVTNIFIPMNAALQEVMDNFDHYFAFERVPDFIGKNGFLYLKDKLSHMNVYRKGIRCYDTSHESLVDYNLANVKINESRLIVSESEFDHSCRSLLEECDNVNIIKQIILSERYFDHWPEMNPIWKMAYEELIAEGTQFITQSISHILGLLVSGRKEIKAVHYQYLIKEGMIDNPMDAAFNHLDFAFQRVDGPSQETEAVLARVGQFKVFFGLFEAYHPVKYNAVRGEFFINRKALKPERDENYYAALCLKYHPTGEELISKLFFQIATQKI